MNSSEKETKRQNASSTCESPFQSSKLNSFDLKIEIFCASSFQSLMLAPILNSFPIFLTQKCPFQIL